MGEGKLLREDGTSACWVEEMFREVRGERLW